MRSEESRSRQATAAQPVDPDVDLNDPGQRRELRRSHYGVLAVIAAGGALGALARFEASRLWPTPAGAFPWTTLLINAAGCLAIGIFLVAVTEFFTAHHLLRPFLATGVLGGFTTFSTYCVDIERLVNAGHAATALAYLTATAAAAMTAVGIGAFSTRRLLADRSQP
ncbi:FluC/FEX family fluoride channel [Streptomyces coelicoflavus]|jgi:CrcB protein|uniref:Fluoride-specific ion channel FluC n=1 Tax=Streptomyces albus (strain ATCC 21838 / DSM 41398 / FERM P-419 / JCM 4703 / NBRC 107858) TaxID=1081613 RepID=A0A0B5ESB1_STRA4|nr:camphor resistance protein [Streptomyces albus]AOU75941.1 camphor resistance protein [Streptomyces albus]AYN31746.1 CrcB family protein [Streptomyces albus]MCP8710555.1 CrcB family protein [Streptomyces sp. AC04842]WDI21674.1 CrcB family protein [Streptomyces enissocaesilis]